MFDELSRDTELEKAVYKPTAWNKFKDEEPDALPVSEPRQELRIHKTEEKKDKPVAGILENVTGFVGSIRDIITKNEDWLMLAIILVILADSDDNTELLIALAVLFYPSIMGLFKK